MGEEYGQLYCSCKMVTPFLGPSQISERVCFKQCVHVHPTVRKLDYTHSNISKAISDGRTALRNTQQGDGIENVARSRDYPFLRAGLSEVSLRRPK